VPYQTLMTPVMSHSRSRSGYQFSHSIDQRHGIGRPVATRYAESFGTNLQLYIALFIRTMPRPAACTNPNP